MVLKLRQASPHNYWEGAKCHKVNVLEDDPFFSEEEDEQQDAVDFCNGAFDAVCPLRDECLLFALTNNEKFGVWGGSLPITRKAIRKKYPSRGGKPNQGWRWMSEEDALEGLDRRKLQKELDEDTRN